jgi:hypothetical protein
MFCELSGPCWLSKSRTSLAAPGGGEGRGGMTAEVTPLEEDAANLRLSPVSAQFIRL